ncbi:Ribosome biogenesis protein MAK21 [Smittium culicis]|uniref:Ribosome biogenesis protein MAK21 n=1 Tax=Smittium culicis TaxID=133412 RepID=A0A1R1YAL7_9FUNG|nr:Ribosome biogenesis protein MAK21 [Smittium culicis]
MANKSEVPKNQKSKKSKKANKNVDEIGVESIDFDSNKSINDSSDLHQSIKDFASSIGLDTSPATVAKTSKSDKNLSKVNKKKSSGTSKPTLPLKNNPIKENSSDVSNTKSKDLTAKTNKSSSEKTKTQSTPLPKQRASESISKNPPRGTKIVFGEDDSTATVIKQSSISTMSGKKSNLLIEPSTQWYNHNITIANSKNLNENSNDLEALSNSEKYARDLLDLENKTYENKRKHGKNSSMTSNDMDFVSSILKTGTLSDKISALTLLVQESPIHNLSSINTLMGMARKNHRREAIMAVSSLKDLLVNNLLPDRKLIYFADRNWSDSGNVQPQVWIYWIFEDFIKKSYFELIKIMEEMLYDNIEHIKISALMHIEDLLESKPEQEHNLLRLLVTKLGDKSKKVSSKASFLILQLLNKHPNMKSIVIKTTQELMLTKIKTGNERGQYYSMITLNQIVLTSRDSAAANSLIDAFLNFFQTIASKSDLFNDNSDEKKPKKNVKSTYIRKAYYGRNAMIKSKSKASEDTESDSKSLENRLMAAILTGLNRALPFSNLPSESWGKYTDLLFKVSHSANFNIVIQTLLFLLQITKTGSIDSGRFYRTLYDSLLDTRIESSSKQGLYLNLIFKSLQFDNNIERLQSFVKRLLQVSLYHSIPFICGILFIISEIAQLKPKIRNLWKSPELPATTEIGTLKEPVNGDEKANNKSFSDAYDPYKREPLYSNAGNSRCWETIIMLRHFHPTVAIQVAKLVNGDRIEKSSNLHIHSLTHFLDRFVYRKPKKETKKKGNSIMQPLVLDSETQNTLMNTSNLIGSGQLTWSKAGFTLNPGLDKTYISKKTRSNLNELANLGSEFSDSLTVLDDTESASNADVEDSTAPTIKPNRQKLKSIPRYLIENQNSINVENIFFQRFMKMKATSNKSKKKTSADDENFDIISEGKNEEGSDDSDIANDLDTSFLADDKTGFSSAMMLAESEPGKNKSSKKKSSQFDDDLSEDEVWKAISAGMPNPDEDDDDDDDDLDGFYDGEDDDLDLDQSDFDGDDLENIGELDESDFSDQDTAGYDDFGDSDTESSQKTSKKSKKSQKHIAKSNKTPNGSEISHEFDSDEFDSDSVDDLDMLLDEEEFPSNNKKRKSQTSSNETNPKDKSNPKKRVKNSKLPMMASYEDYAALIDG